MLKSFADKDTEKVWRGEVVSKWDRTLRRRAYVKLRLIHAATNLTDLKTPPGNRLELLQGTRAGQHSVRVNRRWRICFRWTVRGAEDVQLVDYHR